LEDDHLNLQIGDEEAVSSPQDSPGDPGSPIPGIEAFRDPAQDPELAPIFEHIHFEYNSSLIKDSESIRVIQKIAEYMKRHPRFYVFVEGHCDKRGSSSYNLALGANRANTVRTAIVQEGVSPDQLFTISYGKERPLFEDEGDEFFRLNRRAQFKIYEK
jgi:peptidoglycan-associated lipoprotein